MGRKSERGEGRMGGLILLVVLLAGGLAAWHIVPVYYDHYDFVDKVNEICRTPPWKARQGDDTIKKMLMDEVSKRRLTPWIGPESFAITSTQHLAPDPALLRARGRDPARIQEDLQVQLQGGPTPHLKRAPSSSRSLQMRSG